MWLKVRGQEVQVVLLCMWVDFVTRVWVDFVTRVCVVLQERNEYCRPAEPQMAPVAYSFFFFNLF